MNMWLDSLKNGFELYLKAAPLALIITFGFIYVKKTTFNILQLIGIQCLLLYIFCLVEVVLFPLPDAEMIAAMNGYSGQYIPFRFVSDILREKTLKSVLQVLFNILMTVPFGFFLKFFLNVKRKNVILLTFLLSLVIEIMQLTGLFFIFPGSYRLFDVDDLMLNTLGGFAGTVLSNYICGLLPDIHSYDIVLQS